MLFPDDDGFYSCDNEGCKFKTDDVFDYFDHCNIEFTWGVRVTPKWSFDLYHFMRVLTDLAYDGKEDELINLIQDTAVLFANSSSDELEDFIEETVVLDEVDEGIRNIERMLRENE